jgi:hypothetical protein
MRVWQVDDSSKTAKDVARDFARTYWAEPRRVVGFKSDGAFKVTRGVRTYRVFEDGKLWVVEVVDDPFEEAKCHA